MLLDLTSRWMSPRECRCARERWVSHGPAQMAQHEVLGTLPSLSAFSGASQATTGSMRCKRGKVGGIMAVAKMSARRSDLIWARLDDRTNNPLTVHLNRIDDPTLHDMRGLT